MGPCGNQVTKVKWDTAQPARRERGHSSFVNLMGSYYLGPNLVPSGAFSNLKVGWTPPVSHSPQSVVTHPPHFFSPPPHPTPPPLLLWPLRPSLHYHRGLLPHIFCSQRPCLLPSVPARPAASMASSLCQGPIPWFPTASRITSLPRAPTPCMVSLPPMSTTTSHPEPSTTTVQPCCLSMLLSAPGSASWPPVTLTAAP